MKGIRNQYGFRKSLKERFEDKYIPIPESGCWLWIGAINSSGYGSIVDEKNKIIGAHRASWIIYKGEIPKGMSILHKCDIPSCVNPDHLFIGTQLDNIEDRHKKDRDNHKPNIFGESHPFAKLTTEQAKEAKYGKESQAFYHRKFNVPPQLISDIRLGKTWRHI